MLPAPVSTETPIDDSAPPAGEGTTQSPPVVAVGGTLSVRIPAGIVDHALVPQSGTGTTLHVVTGDRTTTLPDATAFGLPAPRGVYAWTVQSFPTVLFTERLGGEDGRVAPPSWTSAPHAIVIPVNVTTEAALRRSASNSPFAFSYASGSCIMRSSADG